MKLEPEIAAFVQRSNELYDSSTGLSFEQQRAEYDRYCAYYTPPLPAGMVSSDQSIKTPHRDVAVRWYSNIGSNSKACVVYFHGGGFVVGGLNSHDFICSRLGAGAGCTVVSVDYRLAPEHVFPAAFDDCLGVLQVLQSTAEQHGIDARRMVLCGDSAGGNLAAAVALAHRDLAGTALRGQVMIYPMLAADTQLPAYRECRDAPLLTTRDVQTYYNLYLGDQGTHSMLSAPLLCGNLAGSPPALLLPVEIDPLRDDAFAYHHNLLGAGADSSLYLGKGLVHGCLRAVDTSPGVASMYRKIIDFITDVTR